MADDTPPNDSMLMRTPARVAILCSQHCWDATQARGSAADQRKVSADKPAPGCTLALIKRSV